MIKVRTKSTILEKVPYASDPGSPIREVYTPQIGKDGQITLVCTGKEDIQKMINADRDCCDINSVVARFTAGDASALVQGNPVFLDVTGMPKTLAEAYALNFRAEHAFENLPAEVKARFENNFYLFLQSAGSDEWFDKLGSIVGKDPGSGPIEKEVTTDA